MSLTEPQKLSMMVASTVSSWVSIVGSVSILVVLFRSPSRLSTTYRRLMFGVSISDLLCSIGWGLGDLPAPRGTPGTLFAYGNTGLCTAQGLFTFMGQIASALYICSLSLYYLLTITGYSTSMHDQNVNLKLEIALHAVPILWVTVTGLYMVTVNSFNFSGHVCWIAPEPINCILNDSVECNRGEHSYDHRWWFAGYPLFVCCGFIILCMLFLIWTVIQQWAKTRRFHRRNVLERYQQASTPVNEEGGSTMLAVDESASATPEATSSRFSSRQQRGRHTPEDVTETINQALLYIAGFILTYSVPIVNQLLRMSTGKIIFVLYLIANILGPMQGAFNFFIFIRPRLVMLRRSHPNMTFRRLVWTAVTTRAETSTLSRRRGSVRLAVTNRPPRRGFTARELYLQQQANNAEASAQQGPEANNLVPIACDLKLERIRKIVGDGRNLNNVDVLGNDKNEDIGRNSGSTKPTETSQVVRSEDEFDTLLEEEGPEAKVENDVENHGSLQDCDIGHNSHSTKPTEITQVRSIDEVDTILKEKYPEVKVGNDEENQEDFRDPGI